MSGNTFDADEPTDDQSADDQIDVFDVYEAPADRPLRGVDSPSRGDEDDTPTGLDDLDDTALWETFDVTVLAAWDSDVPWVAQSGVVGDETGSLYVSVRSDADSTLETGESVRLADVRVKGSDGDYALRVTPRTTVERLEHEVEARFVTEQATAETRV